MEGVVYVPYNGIGGTNLDNGIMMADITGSSDSGSIEGERPLGANIYWSLPGGITNGGGGQGGEWGYLLWRPTDNINTVTTADLCNYLTKTSNIQFDENYNLVDESQASLAQTTINSLVWEYGKRIMRNAGQPGSDYSWDDFMAYFVSCVVI